MVFRSRTAKAERLARASEVSLPEGQHVTTEMSSSVLLPGAPLSDQVFSACGAIFTWEDVREWMVADGTWAACARRAAEGRELALTDISGPSGDALRQAAQRFRRDRKLIAGEDLSHWLAHWGISEEEWVDWLDRSLRREAHPGSARPSTEASEQETWVEAVCSRELGLAARNMSRAYGAWCERSGGEAPPAAERFALLRRAYEDFVEQAPDRAELERVISSNAVGWIQIAFESASFPTSDAAREALASCRDDGESLASVATLAGVDFEDATVRAEDVEPRLRTVLVSAPVDAPVPAGTPEDPGRVVVVRGRRQPKIDDPADEELAAAVVAEQRVQSATDRWVTWRA